jgi:hypothetical protein
VLKKGPRRHGRKGLSTALRRPGKINGEINLIGFYQTEPGVSIRKHSMFDKDDRLCEKVSNNSFKKKPKKPNGNGVEKKWERTLGSQMDQRIKIS